MAGILYEGEQTPLSQAMFESDNIDASGNYQMPSTGYLPPPNIAGRVEPMMQQQPPMGYQPQQPGPQGGAMPQQAAPQMPQMDKPNGWQVAGATMQDVGAAMQKRPGSALNSLYDRYRQMNNDKKAEYGQTMAAHQAQLKAEREAQEKQQELLRTRYGQEFKGGKIYKVDKWGDESPVVIGDYPLPQEGGTVQSRVDLENGNIGYLDKYGNVIDTGRKSYRQQSVEAVGGMPVVRGANGVTTLDGRPLTQEGYAAYQAEAEAKKQAALAREQAIRVAQQKLPENIDTLAKLEESAAQMEVALKGFQEGRYQTGPVAGLLPSVRPAAKELDMVIKNLAILSTDKVPGALSDEERKWLMGLVIDPSASEEVNLANLRRAKGLQQRIMTRLRSEIEAAKSVGAPGSTKQPSTSKPEGWDQY